VSVALSPEARISGRVLYEGSGKPAAGAVGQGGGGGRQLAGAGGEVLDLAVRRQGGDYRAQGGALALQPSAQGADALADASRAVAELALRADRGLQPGIELAHAVGEFLGTVQDAAAEQDAGPCLVAEGNHATAQALGAGQELRQAVAQLAMAGREGLGAGLEPVEVRGRGLP